MRYVARWRGLQKGKYEEGGDLMLSPHEVKELTQAFSLWSGNSREQTRNTKMISRAVKVWAHLQLSGALNKWAEFTREQMGGLSVVRSSMAVFGDVATKLGIAWG